MLQHDIVSTSFEKKTDVQVADVVPCLSVGALTLSLYIDVLNPPDGPLTLLTTAIS